MIRKLFKAAAYAKAPKSTFAALHPFKAAKYGALFWVGKQLLGGKDKAKGKRRARA